MSEDDPVRCPCGGSASIHICTDSVSTVTINYGDAIDPCDECPKGECDRCESCLLFASGKVERAIREVRAARREPPA